MTVGELLFESLGFHVDDDVNGDLRAFCDALCSPIEDVFTLTGGGTGETPWAIAFDVDNAPAFVLPWLAQFVGVVITNEMSEQQIRAEIRQPTGWRRGQPESIQIAVRRTLTGEDPLVIIHPNTPEVGRHYIRTLLSQTPNPTRTAEIVRAAVPAWSVLDYEAIAGPSVADVAASAKWETVADLAAAFPSVEALTEILPTEL